MKWLPMNPAPPAMKIRRPRAIDHMESVGILHGPRRR